MQHYTSIEQSKKLVELGLNPDTADMIIVKDNTYCNALSAFNCVTLCQNYSETKDKTNYIPCWSLGALLEAMPYRTEMSRKVPYSKIMKRDVWDGAFCFICYPKGLEENKHISDYHNNSLDAAFEMVCWLLENGYIKKGE